MISWFARNHVAANLLMIGILITGFMTITRDVALELMPDFALEIVTITTVLPGGNPKSIEETITTRIEEAIADIEGVEEVSSRSSEGFSSVSAKIEAGYDKQAILSDIKIRVDALNTLPLDAERPIIQLAEVPIQVIGLSVYGDAVSYDDLFQIAADAREALLQVRGITQVSELQAPGREMHIEVEPETLQQYNLTLASIGRAIQANSIDISAGNLQTRDGDILVRTNGQAYFADQFRRIPVTRSGDCVVYLEEIATIRDGYQLVQVETTYNAEQAITFEVYRVGKQSTIDLSRKTKEFVAEYQDRLPPGVNFGSYGETAKVVEDRLNTLLDSAIMGGILVMILLALFLRPAVAFWVGIGIPVCFMGAFALMPIFGITLNMLTMFAFLIVLGIVVDDAIVTGENIYRHQRLGMAPQEAAIFGTKEVAVPVTFGVVTTMAAFAPLLTVQGELANFAKQIPLVVIPVLAFSLVESKLILPAHLSTVKARDENKMSRFSRVQQNFSRGFEQAIIKFYKPFLNKCIGNKTVTIVTALCVFLLTMAVINTGWLRASFFPEFQDDAVFVNLSMPSTTGYETTKQYVDHISNSAREISDEFVNPETGESLFKYYVAVSGLTFSQAGLTFGTNKGIVIIEVASAEERPADFNINEVQERLREQIGDIPGAEKLSFSASFGDFGSPISVSILGDDFDKINDRVEDIREYLRGYPGVFDIQDNYTTAKEEIQLELKPLADSLGLSLSNISSQVRQAVFGFEAQRIQRGYDELKVMVRYPLENRSSLNDVANMPISVGGSDRTVPLTQLATLSTGTSPTAIYRDDQRRVVTVSADLNTDEYDEKIIQRDLTQFLDELFAQEPNLNYELAGQAETEQETNESFLLGFIAVIVMIYALLAIPFKSFTQPFIVMSIIPLAIVGAVVGHIIMNVQFSMLSVMGILALTGIVVNDSLVLVDYINKERARGTPIMEAVLTAGEVRFRPVMLTSLTTFVGLMPLMFSSNLQAQALIPMAISLGYGIIFATLITLVVIPVNYLIFYQLGLFWHDIDDDEAAAKHQHAMEVSGAATSS
ncbi:MAG: efflux RND transporter permease subunit [Pseudomonadota bacterium]